MSSSPIKTFLMRLLQQPFLRAVLTLVSSTVSAQVLMLAVTPLLTRLYLPQDFGAVAVFMAIASVIWTVSSGRYELAITLPPHTQAANQVWALAQLINLAVAMVCAISYLFAKDIAYLANTPSLEMVWWCLPLYILAAGWYRANNYMALREHQYGLIAKSKMTQSAGSALGQIAAFWLAANALGLILGQVLGQAIGAWQLARLKNLGWRTFLHFLSFKKRWLTCAKRYKRFPIYDVPAALIDVLSVQLPNLLLASFFGANIAGFYMLAERMVALPIALVGQSVGQVLFGFSRQALDQGQMFKMALKAVMVLIALIALPTLVVFFASEPLFAWVFGSEWLQAGSYAKWLMLGVAVQFVYAPTSMLLMATNGQKLNLTIHCVMLTGKAAAIYWGYSQASAIIAIQGFAWVTGLGYGLALMAILWHVYQHGLPQK